MSSEEDLAHAREVRARQRRTAVAMALALAAFAALMYFITIARMSGG